MTADPKSAFAIVGQRFSPIVAITVSETTNSHIPDHTDRSVRTRKEAIILYSNIIALQPTSFPPTCNRGTSKSSPTGSQEIFTFASSTVTADPTFVGVVDGQNLELGLVNTISDAIIEKVLNLSVWL